MTFWYKIASIVTALHLFITIKALPFPFFDLSHKNFAAGAVRVTRVQSSSLSLTNPQYFPVIAQKNKNKIQ
jgi:hypothetical protein